MTRSWGAGAVAAASAGLLALVLSGCVSAPQKPSPPTKTEVDAYISAILDRSWESSGLGGKMARPKFTPKPFETAVASSDKLAGCFAGTGYQLDSYYWSPDRGYELMSSDGRPVTNDKKQLAFYTCLARFPADPVASGELLGADQRRYLYDRYSSWTLPCLWSHAYQLADVPTRADYMKQTNLWTPYQSVTGIDTQQEYDAMVAACGLARLPD